MLSVATTGTLRCASAERELGFDVVRREDALQRGPGDEAERELLDLDHVGLRRRGRCDCRIRGTQAVEQRSHVEAVPTQLLAEVADERGDYVPLYDRVPVGCPYRVVDRAQQIAERD